MRSTNAQRRQLRFGGCGFVGADAFVLKVAPVFLEIVQKMWCLDKNFFLIMAAVRADCPEDDG